MEPIEIVLTAIDAIDSGLVSPSDVYESLWGSSAEANTRVTNTINCLLHARQKVIDNSVVFDCSTMNRPPRPWD